MTITRHKKFKKHYQKRILPHPKLDRQFQARLTLFLSNPHHPSLADHALIGSLKGLRSFSITGESSIKPIKISSSSLI